MLPPMLQTTCTSDSDQAHDLHLYCDFYQTRQLGVETNQEIAEVCFLAPLQ